MVKRGAAADGGREGAALRAAAAAALLALAVVAVFFPAVRHDFVNFDDDQFVTRNAALRAGLTWAGVRWAFTTFQASNWVPLTWLSHLLDVALFGLDPRGHHLVSVLLHGANAAALFLVLRAMTGAAGRSLFVAALFGLHPLHVESVAWVAERRDVLSTLFLLLAVGAYHRYARRPAAGRFLAVAACAALGLLAKPMLVTLPALLLVLDFWPLRRWQGAAGRGVPLSRLLIEKVPLALLAAGSALMTWLAQSRTGAVGSVEVYPLWSRALNAGVAAVAYLGRMLWPAGLAAYYPHPGAALPVARGLLALAALALLTVAAVALRRSRPHLLAGWLWYLVALLPVSGIVQVGTQAMADRYTYVPLTGIFIALAWGVPELLPAGRLRRLLPAAAGAAVVVALAAATRAQLATWENSVTLMTRAILVVSGGPGRPVPAAAWFLPYNLGNAWSDAGRHDRAVEAYLMSVAADPRRAEPCYNLGNAYAALGRQQEAAAAYERAVGLEPGYTDAWYNLANTDLLLGRAAESRRAFEKAAALERGAAR